MNRSRHSSLSQTMAQMRRRYNTRSNGGNAAPRSPYTPSGMPPVADAGDDQTVDVDTDVTFDGSGSRAHAGRTITSYSWNFGPDATPATGTGVRPSCSYSTHGEKTVTLTVTDSGGDTDSDTMTVTVSEAISLTLTGPDTVTRGDATRYTASIIPADLTLDATPTFNWKYTADIRGNTVRVTERIGATSQNPQTTTWSGTMVSGGTLEVRTTVNGTEYVQTMNVTVTDRAWVTEVPITTDTTSWGVEAPGQHSDLGDVEYDIPFTAADDLDAAAVSSGPNKGILYTASLNLTAPFIVKINRHFGMADADLPPCWVAFKEANTRYGEIESKVKARLGFDGTTSGTLYGSWESEIHYSDPKANLEEFMEIPGYLSDYETQIVYYVEYIQRSRKAGMDRQKSGWSPSGITINYDYFAADAGDDQTVAVRSTVNFDGSGSVVPQGRQVTYTWGFGDATTDTEETTATGAQVTHTYDNPGVYTVTLTITDDQGIETMDTMTVTAFQGTLSVDTNRLVIPEDPPSESAGGASGPSGASGASGTRSESGTTTETTTPDTTPTTSIATPTVAITYAVEPARQFFSPSRVRFSIEGTIDGRTYAKQYNLPGQDQNTNVFEVQWDGTDNLGNRVPDGNYTVRASVYYQDSEQSGYTYESSTHTITVKTDYRPVAVPRILSRFIVVGAEIDFDGSGSYDPDDSDTSDSGISYYHWDFGEGATPQTVSGPNASTASCTYSSEGEKTVILTVIDNDGGQALNEGQGQQNGGQGQQGDPAQDPRAVNARVTVNVNGSIMPTILPSSDTTLAIDEGTEGATIYYEITPEEAFAGYGSDGNWWVSTLEIREGPEETSELASSVYLGRDIGTGLDTSWDGRVEVSDEDGNVTYKRVYGTYYATIVTRVDTILGTPGYEHEYRGNTHQITVFGIEIATPNEDDVFLVGDEISFAANIQPSSLSSHVDQISWSFTTGSGNPASGTGGAFSSVISSAGEVTIKAEIAIGGHTAEDEVNIETVLPQVTEIDFVGDDNHQIYDVGAIPEFKRSSNRNEPACYTRGGDVTIKAKFEADKALSSSVDVLVDADNGQGDPIRYGEISTSWQNWPSASSTIDSSDSLVNQVKRYDGNFNMNWRFKVQKEGCSWVDMKNSTTSHTLYQVFDLPQCPDKDFTKSHIDFSCLNADGADSEVAVADAIHEAIGNPVDPPHEPNDLPHTTEAETGWELIDSPNTYHGECDEQAMLMRDIVNLLGLEAEVKLVRASTDAGAGNCLHIETMTLNGKEHWLIMDFPLPEREHFWNLFEACCVTANFYYAVWPKLKGTDDYDILQQLGCQQYWVNIVYDPEADRIYIGSDDEDDIVLVPIPQLD